MKNIILKSPISVESIDVKNEHKGIAFILNQDYRCNFNELEKIFPKSKVCRKLDKN